LGKGRNASCGGWLEDLIVVGYGRRGLEKINKK